MNRLRWEHRWKPGFRLLPRLQWVTAITVPPDGIYFPLAGIGSNGWFRAWRISWLWYATPWVPRPATKDEIKAVYPDADYYGKIEVTTVPISHRRHKHKPEER